LNPGIAPCEVAMVAGEASGDLLAAQLLNGIHERWPDWRVAGIGGPQMQAQGFEAWWPSEKLAVRGYIEVLWHYREIVGIRRRLRERLLAHPPRLFVGVDAPDFNLDLEGDLRAAGVKTVHLVAPAVWAWRPERIEIIRRHVNHLLCIFPFEADLFRQAGIDATYVGHPLAPLIPVSPDRQAARQKLGRPPGDPLVALLPGSRRAEIEHLLPRFLKAAQRMRQSMPEVGFILPAVAALLPRIESLVALAGMQDVVQVIRGDSHTALAACDVTLIASGTATLEAALYKRPMVIAYHMNGLSWMLHQRKRLQPWVGLPNILAGEFVVPEFLQEAATPDALAQATLAWLARDPDTRARVERLSQRFTRMHQELTRNTSELAIDAIAKVLA